MLMVKVKFLGPTVSKGARLRVSKPFERTGKIYSFDYSADSPTRQAAEKWLKEAEIDHTWEFLQSIAYDNSTNVVLFRIKSL